MAWNVFMTIRGKLRDEAPLTDAAYDPARDLPIAADQAGRTAPELLAAE